jgi:MFS family permease
MKKTLWIIALIAVVNALGYGIIIPVLYSYSRQFGLTDFQNGMLFSIFSIGQFLATPLIGRLSDAYGRRPVLLASVFGTAASFFIMAFAPNAIFLFIARLLDGITAGNIPVAAAVISDTTDPKNRAKGFGIIGASFGFGFTFGPAISAFSLRWGTAAPFVIAGSIALIACVLIWFLLPETNTHKSAMVSRHLFDFRKLFSALFDPAIGKTLLVSFLVVFAFSIYIYAFQPFAVQLMHMSAQEISLIFTGIGVVGLISQVAVIPRVVKRFGERRVLVGALSVTAVIYMWLFGIRSPSLFMAAIFIQAFANGFPTPILQSLLSKEADDRSQGAIMGINMSYQSIGQIFGPIVGGVLATITIPLPLVAASATIMIAIVLSFQMLHKHLRQQPLV